LNGAEQGKLIGSISTTDVKYLFLGTEILLTLQRPVSVYVAAIRQSSTHWQINLQSSSLPSESRSVYHSVNQRATLNQALDVLLQKRIRRLWVINDSEHPIGVLSISDIIKAFLPNPATALNQPTKPHRTAK
jgi:CBS domain-containing protein